MTDLTFHDDFERLVVDWLDEAAGARVPDYLDETLDRIERLRQRPAWMSPWRWLPMDAMTLRRFELPRAVPYLAVLGLLLLVVVVTVLVAGSQRRLPPPFGPAGAGLIAYSAEGDLWVANADGSDVRRLFAGTAYEFGATWSRDGTRIAYWSSTRLDDTADERQAELWVAGMDGQNARKVSGDLKARPGLFDQNVSWSPDGDTLAFTTGARSLYIVGADGSNLRQLGDDALYKGTPAWSPDGDWIAFSGRASLGSQADPTRGVYVIHASGRDQTKVSTATGGEFAFIQPTWSPDGSRLLYHVGAPVGDVAVARRLGNGWTEELIVRTSADEAFPTWSNDGKRIAYMHGTGHPVAYVHVVDAAGGEPQRLSSEAVGLGGLLCWSPDDRSILAVSPDVRSTVEQQERPVLLILAVDEPRTLARLTAPGFTTWAGCAWQRVAP